MKFSGPSCFVLLVFLVSNSSTVLGQSKEPPIEDKRLSIHTLIREDIFAGWRADNAKRLKRGEENIERLLKTRPESKADLLAWKGGVALYHAVVANENKDAKVYETKLKDARRFFDEAKKANPESNGVYSLIGGSNAMFADRLAEKDQPVAWQQSYDSYHMLWKSQGPKINQMPLHIGGELLAGLAQSAQRLGKMEEVTTHLDKIVEVYDGSGYAKEAKRWQADPKSVGTRKIVCKSCHSQGRLKATLTRLDSK